MSNLLVASVPIHGHVTPLLSVVRQLVARGHTVRFVTGARFASAVRATGARFVPLPSEADFDDRIDIEERFPARQRLSGAKAIAFDIEHLFMRPARAQATTLAREHALEPADVLLSEPAFCGSALLLGMPRTRRPAVVGCGVLPLVLASADTAPYGMGIAPARWFNRPRNAVLAALARPVFAAASRLADDMYREQHRVAMPFPALDWMRHAEAIVQFTVPAFEYPRADAPASLVFAGPLSATGSAAPRPPWWSELGDGRPLVHLTQGTLANKDYCQLIAPALQALAAENVHVVVATGGRPLDTLPPLPPNARAAVFLPYDELLPRTDVYVTNGGYGGVQYALRHGVPIVATGGKEDKPEVGARVAWAGVGLRLRSERPSPQALRRAILRVLREPSYRQASRRIAADMACAGGIDTLLDVVERVSSHDEPTANRRSAVLAHMDWAPG